MAQLQAETEYQLITLQDGTYGVRVFEADRLPRTVVGFDCEEEAEVWIYHECARPTGSDGLPMHL